MAEKVSDDASPGTPKSGKDLERAASRPLTAESTWHDEQLHALWKTMHERRSTEDVALLKKVQDLELLVEKQQAQLSGAQAKITQQSQQLLESSARAKELLKVAALGRTCGVCGASFRQGSWIV